MISDSYVITYVLIGSIDVVSLQWRYKWYSILFIFVPVDSLYIKETELKIANTYIRNNITIVPSSYDSLYWDYNCR